MLKILKKSKLKIWGGIFFLVSLVPRSEILRESLKKILVKICLSHHHSPHRLQVYLLPLEGVRGVKPSLGEGWGRSCVVGVGFTNSDTPTSH